MKHVRFVCLCLAIALALFGQSSASFLAHQHTRTTGAQGASQPGLMAQARILDSYGKLPLSFEANHGQVDARVRFLSRTSAYSLFLTGDEAVLTLLGSKLEANSARSPDNPRTSRFRAATRKIDGVLRMKLRNPNPAVKVAGVDRLAGTSNYFIGNDSARWRTSVPTFAKVRYEGIYSGIDLVYYGNQRQLEYDFVVAPGADPNKIAFDVGGASRISKDKHGDLIFNLGKGKIRWRKPVVYQEENGARHEIAANYAIPDTNRIAFELAKYDASKPLYIDPLIYSTYLGGSGSDWGEAIAVDSSGNAYITGYTSSTDFPATPGALQTSCGTATDCQNIFVTKFNATGSSLVYSTYLGPGGANGGAGIAVDTAGDAYIVGTNSGIPTTPGAFQTTCGGGGCTFVSEINPSGSALIYSTFLGGGGFVSDHGYAIAVDSTGSAYVTGQTYDPDFPVTPGAFQPSAGGGYTIEGGFAYVAKFNPAGTALAYASYLGAGGDDRGNAIAVDAQGNAYVTGATCATNFPVTPGAFQTTAPGGSCGNDPGSSWGWAFVTQVNPTGTEMGYSTYLGGSGITHGLGIAVNGDGNAYVTGYTFTANFPTTPGAFQTVCNHGSQCARFGDAFVTEFNSTGSGLVYSTYLGGSKGDSASSIALDSAGDAYITGSTNSTNFPTSNPIQSGSAGNAFVSKLNPTGSALVSSTYLGGGNSGGYSIAVDSAGNPYVTGYTGSSDFPTTSGAFQTTTCSSPCIDAFVTKLDLQAPSTVTLSSSPNASAYGQAVDFTVAVTSQFGAVPDGETVTFEHGSTVLGTGTSRGGTATLLYSALGIGTTPITAVYGGDWSFGKSSSQPLKQTVTKAASATALTSSQNPSSYDQPITFTATVSPQFSGIPTGTVKFSNGTVTLGSATLAGGVARYTTTRLALGTASFTAKYLGSDFFDTSTSAPVSQVVNQASTTTTLVSSANPSNSKQSVTFTATVAGQYGGTVTGSVVFTDGTTTLKTANLSGNEAKFTSSTLAVGTHNITATYVGSTEFGTSSAALTQSVQ